MNIPKQYGSNASVDPAAKAKDDLEQALAGGESDDLVRVVDPKLEEKITAKQNSQQAESDEKHVDPVVKVSEALDVAPVLEQTSERETPRVLCISNDASLLDPSSPASILWQSLAQYFSEVHIIISVPGDQDAETYRRHDNTWIYVEPIKTWWLAAFQLAKLAKKQLSFGDGFRADVIITDDPCMNGWAGWKLAKEFNRPLQARVQVDPFSEQFKNEDRTHVWLRMVAKHVLQKASTIAVRSSVIRDSIVSELPDVAPYIEVMPTYHDLSGWRTAEAAFDLHEQYPQFKFIILHISRMADGSHTDEAITGVSQILRRYPTIGLIIVGDGSERDRLMRFVEGQALQHQVIFRTDISDLVSCMKSANMLLHTSRLEEDVSALLQAAVLEVPIVAENEGLASELFVDGQSVLLCHLDSPPCFGERVNTLLNDTNLRQRMTMRAEEVVSARVEQDYGAFSGAWVASIERNLYHESDT